MEDATAVDNAKVGQKAAHRKAKASDRACPYPEKQKRVMKKPVIPEGTPAEMICQRVSAKTKETCGRLKAEEASRYCLRCETFYKNLEAMQRKKAEQQASSADAVAPAGAERASDNE